MTQMQVNQLVADATGEDVRSIQRLGFSMADPFDVDFDPEPDNLPPQMIDWDELEIERNVAISHQKPFRRRAA